MKKALNGVKVLEYADLVSAPYCTRILGDMGAEVIKVEQPGTGDLSRLRSPFKSSIPDVESSGLFALLNANKLGVTLDIAKPTGKEIFLDLVRMSDILVENQQARLLRKLGIDYPRLQKINPKLIYVSISPFGRSGPHKDYKAYHLNVYHAGGDGYLLPAGSEYLNRPPVKAGKYVAHYQSGIGATIAVMAAIYEQRISGKGQHIDMSEQEWEIGLGRLYIDRYPNEKISHNRLMQKYAIGGLLKCKDGYVVLMLAQENHWRHWVECMGNPEWALIDKYKDSFTRAKDGAEINRKIEGWMAGRTKEELYHRGQSYGCTIGMVSTSEEVIKSEQMKVREFFIDVEHPCTGTAAYPGFPGRYSETPAAVRKAAPLLGEDNESVYCQRLGLSKEALVKLREAAVI